MIITLFIYYAYTLIAFYCVYASDGHNKWIGYLILMLWSLLPLAAFEIARLKK